MDATQQQFNDAYRAFLPPELRELMAMPDGSPADAAAKTQRASDLAQKGFTVDVPIMVWNWDPYLVMQLRQQFGYTWVPSALQPPITVAPGLPGFGTLSSYDPLHPPAGSIRVSLNLADYPPFDPPAPPAPHTPASDDPVGLQSVGALYLAVPGETYQDGAKYTDGRGTFLKHITFTPFGRTNYWEKVA
ncbi:MAG: hypothetical protein LAP38_13685 [Acidobacteriia bacterium]|nr:hypothetical protein [Terriglobia bacterium]